MNPEAIQRLLTDPTAVKAMQAMQGASARAQRALLGKLHFRVFPGPQELADFVNSPEFRSGCVLEGSPTLVDLSTSLSGAVQQGWVAWYWGP